MITEFQRIIADLISQQLGNRIHKTHLKTIINTAVIMTALAVFGIFINNDVSNCQAAIIFSMDHSDW